MVLIHVRLAGPTSPYAAIVSMPIWLDRPARAAIVGVPLWLNRPTDLAELC